jgi:hypothetical protein
VPVASFVPGNLTEFLKQLNEAQTKEDDTFSDTKVCVGCFVVWVESHRKQPESAHGWTTMVAVRLCRRGPMLWRWKTKRSEKWWKWSRNLP